VYLPGHLGTALLTYAPVLRALLRRRYPRLAAGGTVVVLSLAMLPDVDRVVASLLHRGPTHSLAFVVLTASALAALAYLIADLVDGRVELRLEPHQFAAFGSLLGGLAVLSHLLADVTTPRWRLADEPLRLELLWPASQAHVAVDVVRAGHPEANLAVFLAGVAATGLVWVRYLHRWRSAPPQGATKAGKKL